MPTYDTPNYCRDTVIVDRYFSYFAMTYDLAALAE